MDINTRASMKKFGFLLITACLLYKPLAWADTPYDVCGPYKARTDITIKFLLRMKLEDDDQTANTGKFSIENHSSKPIVIEGLDAHGYFYIFHNATIQYRGTDGIWFAPPAFVADSVLPYRQLKLKPNSGGVFYAFAPRSYGSKPVDQARIVLINDPRGFCVYSEPFPSVNAKP